MLYLYAITEGGSAVPVADGFRDEPVTTVEHEGLAAVCSELDAAPEPTEAAVLVHAAVVETVAASAPVLPVRFGTAFADADSLRSELGERAEGLRAALERVRGRVELGVRVLVAEEQRTPATDGRSYLLGRLEQQRRAATLADEIHGVLAREAVADAVRVTSGPPFVVHAAYLVEVDAVEKFRARAEALAAKRPEAQLLCTGPWPPYSFASIDGERA